MVNFYEKVNYSLIRFPPSKTAIIVISLSSITSSWYVYVQKNPGKRTIALEVTSLVCKSMEKLIVVRYPIVWYYITIIDYSRRGGTKKILGGLIWASDWVPAGLSKRSATIGWRGAYTNFFGFTNPTYGRKRHFPIKNMFSPHFEILPEVPASWSTWQILGGLNIPLAPHFFHWGGWAPQAPPVPPPLDYSE